MIAVDCHLDDDRNRAGDRVSDQEQHYDIFVSYARSDRERVAPMIAALQAPGWRVFWDHDIPPGWTWDEYIGAKLEDARVVLAIWSRESVRSEFVRTEASRARRRRVLVPVRIDDIEPPVEFERVHAADLIDWTRSPHARLPEALQLEVARRLAAADRPANVASAASAPARDAARTPTSSAGADDVVDFPDGYTLQEAVKSIHELVASRNATMKDLFAAQQAQRDFVEAREQALQEKGALEQEVAQLRDSLAAARRDAQMARDLISHETAALEREVVKLRAELDSIRPAAPRSAGPDQLVQARVVARDEPTMVAREPEGRHTTATANAPARPLSDEISSRWQKLDTSVRIGLILIATVVVVAVAVVLNSAGIRGIR